MRVRWTSAALALAAAGAGWLVIGSACMPYAYPVVSHVPTVQLGPERTEVYAFRVNHVFERGGTTLAFEQVPLRRSGRVGSQTEFSFDRGWWPEYFLRTRIEHRVTVRLYRPGYQTVEVPAWRMPDVEWQPATSLAEQERAIDDLLTPHWAERADVGVHADLFWLDSADETPPPAHARVLQFAAAEYERLAAHTEPDSPARASLNAKAARLREVAGSRR